MPEPIQAAGADNLEREAEALISASVQDSPAAEPQVSQDSAQATDGGEVDLDTLKSRLAEREKQLAQREKDYKELQSLSDRHYNQMQEKMAKLEGRLEGLLSKPQSPERDEDIAEVRAKEAALLEKWKADVGEHPEKALEYADARAMQLRQYIDSALEQRFGEVKTKLRELDPVRQKEKETIDALVAANIPEDVALQVALALSKKKELRQPGVAQAPGVAPEGRRQTQVDTAPKMVDVDPVSADVLRMLGYKPKDVNRIRLEAAKELAQ